MIETQIIRDDEGRPAFAVVPWSRYRKLVGDAAAEDQVEAAWAERTAAGYHPDAETLPDSVAERLVAGENPIKVLREHRKLTQQQLAAQVGIRPPYLSQVETGRRQGSRSLMRRLARCIGYRSRIAGMSPRLL